MQGDPGLPGDAHQVADVIGGLGKNRGDKGALYAQGVLGKAGQLGLVLDQVVLADNVQGLSDEFGGGVHVVSISVV